MRLGTWGVDMSKSVLKSFIHGCIDLGYPHFDHADIYGGYTTEAAFGEVLKSDTTLKNRVEITTKCGINYVCDQRKYKVKSYDLSKDHILSSVDRSLQNLGVEQIHTLLLHRPDYLLEIDEIADAFATLEHSGKVSNFGLSNFNLPLTQMIHEVFPLSMIQVEIHPRSISSFESGLLAYCQKQEISVSSWSPLAGGELLAKPKGKLNDLEVCLDTFSANYNAPKDQILYSWLRTAPVNIIPVCGTSNISRIKAISEFQNLILSKEDWYLLLEAARGIKVA